jgi:hypothetical protein
MFLETEILNQQVSCLELLKTICMLEMLIFWCLLNCCPIFPKNKEGKTETCFRYFIPRHAMTLTTYHLYHFKLQHQLFGWILRNSAAFLVLATRGIYHLYHFKIALAIWLHSNKQCHWFLVLVTSSHTCRWKITFGQIAIAVLQLGIFSLFNSRTLLQISCSFFMIIEFQNGCRWHVWRHRKMESPQ